MKKWRLHNLTLAPLSKPVPHLAASYRADEPESRSEQTVFSLFFPLSELTLFRADGPSDLRGSLEELMFEPHHLETFEDVRRERR